MTADEETVPVAFMGTGTHEGWLRRLPPTGKRVTVIGMWAHRFEDGQIVEGWVAWNEAGVRRQLGVTFPRALVTLPALAGRRLLRAVRKRRSRPIRWAPSDTSEL